MRRSDRAEARTPAEALPRDRILRAMIFPGLLASAVTCGGGEEKSVTPPCADGGLLQPAGRGGSVELRRKLGLGGQQRQRRRRRDRGRRLRWNRRDGKRRNGRCGIGRRREPVAAAPLCGNGSPDPGEECDTGSASETCDADCTRAVCGDGTVNAKANEECDAGGATASCDADCTYVTCGDGTVHANAGERCDSGGETAACDVDCSPPECGDGITNVVAGEACDDGNRAGGDGCSSSCAFERCDNGGDTCANAIPVTLGTNQMTLQRYRQELPRLEANLQPGRTERTGRCAILHCNLHRYARREPGEARCAAVGWCREPGRVR